MVSSTISFLSSDVSMLKVCQILLDLLMFDINSTVCAYLSNMEMKCLPTKWHSVIINMAGLSGGMPLSNDR